MELVASSSISTGGSATAALAIARSCLCPWLRLSPSAVSMVLYPSGRCVINQCAFAIFAAFITSSSLASRLPVSYIVHYGACKQMCILKNNSKRPAQVIFINFVYINLIKSNFSVRNVIKSVNKICDSSLSCSGRAYERNFLSRFSIKRNIV